ncbi:MAG: 4'-phosphopantetheinyl transferase superfamily protein [Lysobacter sp.]|nr:MAG: 4'-phosphopantetheinyl transferase superfamily protein [Lysobacter sp.]
MSASRSEEPPDRTGPVDAAGGDPLGDQGRSSEERMPEDRPLDDGVIDLWLSYYDDAADASLAAAMRALLTDDERAQEPRFYFADDRRRYLVTRALVRTVLSRYAPLAPEAWRFAKNDYGRPEIAPDILIAHPQAADLRFNVSHTRGLIALAVVRGREIGVDVEHLRVRAVSLGIADRFFAPDEVVALAQVPEHAQQERFFEYWTFKESYIKARGMGLSLPLDGFSFHYPRDDAVRIAIRDDLSDVPERWRFWQCRPTEDYLLALCAERRDGPAPVVRMRRVVPLSSDSVVTAAFTRRSDDDAD